MMKQFDPETFFRTTLESFQSNLNTQILAINAEKAGEESFELEEVPASVYYTQAGDETWNDKMFVLYAISQIEEQEQAFDAMSINMAMTFELILEDEYDARFTTEERLLRYLRAMVQAGLAINSSASRHEEFDIVPLLPETINQRGNLFKHVGVELRTTLTIGV
jgi:hypothetical protein